jgi:hypothetical protein
MFSFIFLGFPQDSPEYTFCFEEETGSERWSDVFEIT